MRFLLTPAIVLFLFGISQLESQFLGIDFEKKDEHLVTIKAEKRGFPFVNFENGKELFSTNSIASGAQAKALASADFDSDGIADLVTVDSTGRLNLYRGNAEYRSADNKLLKQEDRIAPFYPEAKSFSLNISPDYLETGDFNADGKKDILAVAKNDNNFKLLSGDGKGSFTEPLSIPLDGQITSLAIGEIGKQDGQTDVAAVVTNSKGSFLFVFEHPESAFKHKPEIFKLDSPAASVAIGNLDDDFYADIAVASGNQLTIIHGRGQAYPWDLNKRFGIERPKAVVAKRQMPFAIAGLEIGDFNDSPGEDLAILSNSGSVFVLEPARSGKVSNLSLKAEAGRQAKGILFVPTGTDANKYGVLGDSQIVSAEAAKERGLPLIDSTLSPKERQEFLTERAEEEAKKLEKLSKEELTKRTAEAKAKGEENRRRSKEAFIKTISGRPSTLASWKLVNLISDARLKNAAYAETPQKLFKARVSDSGKDDLVLLDSISKQIQIVAETKTGDQRLKTELVSLDGESNPVSVLKMRLNADSLDDLVVLREGSEQPSFLMTAPAATITVNTTSDGASDCQTPGANCTLRGAIQLANASPGADQINFNIPGSAPHKIQPLTELPVITQTVNIFGGSQPGSAQGRGIEIDGSLIGQPADGLKIRASSCFVTYLSITGFLAAIDPDTGSKIGGNAISLETPVGFARTRFNSLFHNFLGVAPDGVTDKGNQAAGLLLFDSDFNLIENNLMSGNDGAGISVTNGSNNTIRANKIGTNATGTEKLPNGLGMFLTGNNNIIGGDSASSGNTISGNGRQRQPPYEDTCSGIGIYVPPLVSLDTGALLTNGNNIVGNKIGTNSAGTAPLGNCSQGITTHPLTTTTIGSITQDGRNIISDHGYDAIHCGIYDYIYTQSEGGYCSISGNNIGTDITGTVALPNDSRNVLSGAAPPSGVVTLYNNITLSNIGAPGGTTPGGACTGFCNLISGNDNQLSTGAIERYNSGLVIISNNFVGTNKNGTAALPNAISGIYATDSDTFIGGYDTEENVNFGNLVSGNKWLGISVSWWSGFFNATFSIESNLVGTDTTGSVAIPNATDDGLSSPAAVFVSAIENWTVNVGGVNPFSRNYISGNSGTGITALGQGGQINIINNHVGIGKNNQPLGNAKHGILLTGKGVTIGGTGAGEGNAISNNTLAGVAVESFASAGGSSNAASNSIRGNSIRNNGGLGIDLTINTFSTSQLDGVTPNDCNDFDDGPNLRQNFPELSAPTFNQDGTVTVAGSLRSLPSRQYTIDFYSNSAPDPTEHGEGETYIGTLTDVKTNGSGVAALQFTSIVDVLNTRKITATATDQYGNTSEFSCFAGGCGIGNFQNVDEVEKSFANQEFQCLEPIVVNITSDQQDADDREGVPANARDLKCDVDRDTPDNQCSLRAAIQEANARSGINLINFDIPGSGFKTIAPATLLPPITDRVIINGTTQPGYTDSPLIEISGANALSNDDGLNFKTGSGGTSPGNGSAVRGLAFTRWLSDVVFENSNYSEIQNCYIGIKPDGTAGQFEIDNGIVIAGYGVSVSENVISNQDTGIFLNESNAKSCRIERNKIGTDPTGNNKIGNNKGILSIQSSGQHQITENLISGNKGNGIYFLNNSTDETNTISNNLIGTTANGMNALPNTGNGILLENAAKSVITGNTIVGHKGTEELTAGIHLISREPDPVGSDQNIIQSNKIGVAQNGVTAIPNQYGIIIEGSSKNKIGDAENANLRNIIAGNVKTGIYIKDNLNLLSEENEIANNLIGINANNQSPGNQERGIQISGDSPRNKILKNNISGNSIYGVLLYQGGNENVISENEIGILAANGIGIRITESSNNKIEKNQVARNENINILLGNIVPEFPEMSAAEFKAAELRLSSPAAVNTEGNQIYSNEIKNSKIGLAITEGANNNQIGGFGLSNIITENLNGLGYGIFLGTTRPNPSEDLLPSGNKIFSNNIGDAHAGTNSAFPNNVGLFILQAKDNFIGGGQSQEGNQILSNKQHGIVLSGIKTKGNLIVHNSIGYGNSEAEIAGNGGDGIAVVGTGKNSIKYNLIGNNGNNGINAVGLTLTGGEQHSLIISGNQIGVSENGVNPTFKIGNTNAGIRLSNVQNAVIGVSGDAKNLIAGNGGDGILIEGNSGFNSITNSIIGTNQSGAFGYGNGGNGIHIIGGGNNTIGGVPSDGNFISGNDENGIFIENSTLNKLYGNRIGIFSTANGNIKRGNGQNGLKLLNSQNNKIGDGVLTGYRNYIGGNALSGIVLQGASSQFNLIKGNFIGLDFSNTNLGNGMHGVLITEQGQKNIVGGQEIEAGNRIAYNGTQPTHGGVVIDSLAGSGNNVDPNLIYSNAGLGIDLGAPGHTPNDPADADTGPNNLQNYPEIVSRQIVNNELIIGFKVDSAPGNSNYGADGIYMEFFKADASGEGEKFLGFSYYTASDYNNGAPKIKQVNLGSITTLGITANNKITATATDSDGNTSEFMPAVGSIYSISGKVSYRNQVSGEPPKSVAGVLLKATVGSAASVSTNSSGDYLFDNLENGNYTITPSKTGGINGISPFDATLILRYVAANGTGPNALTPIQKIAADANGDGNISPFDATLILRYVAANGSNANTGQVSVWKFDPPSREYAPLAGTIDNQNYEAVLVGEVNGNWTPSSSLVNETATEEQKAKTSDQAINVSLSETNTVINGRTVIVPVIISNETRKVISGLSFGIIYDPAVLQPDIEQPIQTTDKSDGFMLVADTTASGRIGIAGSTANSLIAPDGTFLMMRFKVIGESIYASNAAKLMFSQQLNFIDESGNSIATTKRAFQPN
ncbi:MAG TPA: NosD domain-containing protein [Pyrinomonadaceae bacterium]